MAMRIHAVCTESQPGNSRAHPAGSARSAHQPQQPVARAIRATYAVPPPASGVALHPPEPARAVAVHARYRRRACPVRPPEVGACVLNLRDGRCEGVGDIRHQSKDASMKKYVRLPSPAMAVALLALFTALSASAYAATVITGKNVRNGSLTGADIQSKSDRGDRHQGRRPGRARHQGRVPDGRPLRRRAAELHQAHPLGSGQPRGRDRGAVGRLQRHRRLPGRRRQRQRLHQRQ